VITEEPIRFDAGDTAGDTAGGLGGAEAAHGAVVTFSGVVRDHNEGRPVTGVFYDCYREMAERELERLAARAGSRYPVKVIRLEHRIGELTVGDVSLLIVVASAHRKEAFDACQYIIDEIKKRVPIWKKERYADETSKWL